MGNQSLKPSENNIMTDGTPGGFIQQTDKFIIKRTANHNEIAIMESDWNFIKEKLEKVNFRKTLAWKPFMMGIALPYIIGIVVQLIKGENLDILPLIVCGFIALVLHIMSSKNEVLRENSDEVNKLHLDDIKNRISEIDSHKRE